MDKPFRDLLSGHTGITSLLKDSGLSELQRTINQITEPTRRMQELLTPSIAETMREMYVARELMQPSLAALAIQQREMSFARQALALQLPELSFVQQTNFGKISELAGFASSLAEVIRPTADALSAMSSGIADIIKPHHRFMEPVSWAHDLERRMGLIDVDWLIPTRWEISGLSFGELARFSDSVRFEAPFCDELNEIVIEELGEVVEDPSDDAEEREVQYDAAGRKPALVAFPQESYAKVVVAAGLELVVPAAPVPQPVGNAAGAVTFAGAHYEAMIQLENHLRSLITTLLGGVEPHWEKRRVSGEMRKRWSERREQDRARGDPIFPLIYYSDLGDLGQIMAQGNNWPLFEPIFKQRDDLLISIRRLAPIRNRVMHGRPLSQSEVLFLAAEGVRLLRSMGLITVQ